MILFIALKPYLSDNLVPKHNLYSLMRIGALHFTWHKCDSSWAYLYKWWTGTGHVGGSGRWSS